MDSEPSFQSLMARVELEHFLAYLACNGWQGVPEVRRDRLRFELPDRGSAPYVLLLPSSNQLAQCSSSLQKAVFNLSGIEDRQPLEVVRDLLTVGNRAVPPAPGKRGEPIRLRLRNLSTGEMSVAIASRPTENLLLEGEAMEIVCRPAEGAVVEVGVEGSSIVIIDSAEG